MITALPILVAALRPGRQRSDVRSKCVWSVVCGRLLQTGVPPFLEPSARLGGTLIHHGRNSGRLFTATRSLFGPSRDELAKLIPEPCAALPLESQADCSCRRYSRVCVCVCVCVGLFVHVRVCVCACDRAHVFILLYWYARVIASTTGRTDRDATRGAAMCP